MKLDTHRPCEISLADAVQIGGACNCQTPSDGSGRSDDHSARQRRPIYLDHHASTPVDPRVARVVWDAMMNAFGNPWSVEHAYGIEAARLVERAAVAVAALVGAEACDVCFTSGASEALRTALAAAALAHADSPMRIVLPHTEHAALLDAVAQLERDGRASTRWLGVDGVGRIDLDEIDSEPFDLLCLMAANNEIGTIHPVRAAAAVAHRCGAGILVDATQAAGRIELQSADWGLDFVVLSAHKMYGPKGSGAVVGRAMAAVAASNLLGHPGTPNVPAITGFGEACRLMLSEGGGDAQRISFLRDRLERSLCERIDGIVINGDRSARLGNNLHVSIPGVPNDAVLARLRSVVAASTGSACQSGAPGPSHVLRAIALPPEHQDSALRMSPGRFTTTTDIDAAADAIVAAVVAIRALSETAVCR